MSSEAKQKVQLRSNQVKCNMGLIIKGQYGTFLACEVWCKADISSVNTSSEQTSNYTMSTLVDSTYLPTQKEKTVFFFKTSLQVQSSQAKSSKIKIVCIIESKIQVKLRTQGFIPSKRSFRLYNLEYHLFHQLYFLQQTLYRRIWPENR